MKLLETKNIPTNKLVKSPKNPRRKFIIDDLLPNIKEHGIKKSLTVVNNNGTYEVIDGERRRLCAVELKIKEVSCEIWEMTEEEEWYWALMLNELTQPLDAMSRGYAYYVRKKIFRLSNEDLGKRFPLGIIRQGETDDGILIPISGRQVGKLIRLMILPEKIQSHVEQGMSIDTADVFNRLAFDIEWNVEQNDFDFDGEPKEWKEKRIAFQEKLAEENWTREAIQRRVTEYIDEEKRRREIIEGQKLAKEKKIESYEKDLVDKKNKLTKYLKELKDAGITWSTKDTLTVFDEKISKGITLLKQQRPDPEQLMRYQITFFNMNDLRKKMYAGDKELLFEDGYRCNHCSRALTEEQLDDLIKDWQLIVNELNEQKDKMDSGITQLQNYSREVHRLVTGINRLEKDLEELRG